jgi:hypothetical protein
MEIKSGRRLGRRSRRMVCEWAVVLVLRGIYVMHGRRHGNHAVVCAVEVKMASRTRTDAKTLILGVLTSVEFWEQHCE